MFTSPASTPNRCAVLYELRRAHDRYLTMSQRAQWLLLGGMVVFLASLQATVWRKKIARPGKVAKPAGWQAREILQSSTAVTVLGAGLALGAWMLVRIPQA